MDAAQVASRFGLGARARLSDGPVSRGKQGAIWRLDTADGSWALKVPFQPPAEDDVRASTVFHESAYAAGVPTPRVQRTTDGAVLADLDGTRLRVYEWVDLLPPDIGIDPELVGELLATMHRTTTPDDAPLDPWFREPVGAARWDALVQSLRAAGAPFAERLADLRDELVALESWIEPPRTLVTCHRDLWADNLLPTPDGGVCVIDWENSGPADPRQELGYVLFEFARSDPGRARALTGAYASAGGTGCVAERGDFSLLIAMLGHITEIAGTDWLEPNVRSPDRSDSAAWIGEVLDEPHTRALLDSLLTAVATS
ncbi:phosphotransferase enzyme family protein [Angustibacter sp. McL0619]|uniref:phosphotransferase enzyme family protein n=1 Tax=Angustibacter sp. McL0619 TaxID=3415676 RepID=UPI003CE8367B